MDKKELVNVESESGKFTVSLKRNNTQIRHDRAITIVEDVFLKYKRLIEDLELEIRELERKRESLIDVSPSDTHTIINPNDFDADKYIEKDMNISIELRNLEIKLEISKKRFNYLFSGE